jgi:hypothetical protein
VSPKESSRIPPTVDYAVGARQQEALRPSDVFELLIAAIVGLTLVVALVALAVGAAG